MMTEETVKILYSNDVTLAYKTLKEMEKTTLNSDEYYPYIKEFIDMVNSDKYTLRVRGFRMICVLAKWDNDKIIDESIDDILFIFEDVKPTAIRQAFEYIRFLFPYKKELSEKVRQKVLSIDLSKFKDTMKPLIEKDIENALQLLDLVKDMDEDIFE